MFDQGPEGAWADPWRPQKGKLKAQFCCFVIGGQWGIVTASVSWMARIAFITKAKLTRS